MCKGLNCDVLTLHIRFELRGASLVFALPRVLKLFSAWLLSAGFRPLLLGSARADPHPARHKLINLNEQPRQ